MVKKSKKPAVKKNEKAVHSAVEDSFDSFMIDQLMRTCSELKKDLTQERKEHDKNNNKFQKSFESFKKKIDVAQERKKKFQEKYAEKKTKANKASLDKASEAFKTLKEEFANVKASKTVLAEEGKKLSMHHKKLDKIEHFLSNFNADWDKKSTKATKKPKAKSILKNKNTKKVAIVAKTEKKQEEAKSQDKAVNS